MTSLLLRDYQKKAIEEIEGKHRVVLQAMTGSGKTEIACSLTLSELKNDPNACVLFICERKTLVSQSVSRYKKYGIEPGVIQGDNTDFSVNDRVVVASIQTLNARIKHKKTQELLRRVTLIIIDEVHIVYNQHVNILKHYKGRVVGLTATPLNPKLQGIFHEVIRGPSYEYLIENGYLVKPVYYVPTLDDKFGAKLSKIPVSTTGDYVSSALSKLMREPKTIKGIVEYWKDNCLGRPTIVFCVDKEHSREVSKEFNLSGISCAHIEDSTPDKERMEIFSSFRCAKDRGLNSFRSRDTEVICSVGVLALGFDEPTASCVLLVRPTLSLSLHIQQIGRGLRVSPGKSDCIVVDFALNLRRHGKVEDFSPPDLADLNRYSDRVSVFQRKHNIHTCSGCSIIIPPTSASCPECGKENVIGTPERVYRELLWVAERKRYKSGWAYHKMMSMVSEGYLEPFGIVPRHWSKLTPVEPTTETLNFIRMQNKQFSNKIKQSYAKSYSKRYASA